MKHIFNRTFIVITAIAVALMTSCNKPEKEAVPNLEVNASNLHGAWTLTSVNGALILEETSFYINFNRSGEKFQIWDAMNSIPSSYDYSEGTFKLYSDPELGVYIRGIDNVGEEWSDLYIIKELTHSSMIWIGVNDPSFVQTFERIDRVPVAEM